MGFRVVVRGRSCHKGSIVAAAVSADAHRAAAASAAPAVVIICAQYTLRDR